MTLVKIMSMHTVKHLYVDTHEIRTDIFEILTLLAYNGKSYTKPALN